MILNLNPVMSIIANVPAAIASTVRLVIPPGTIYRRVFSLDRRFPRSPPFGKLLCNRRGSLFVSRV